MDLALTGKVALIAGGGRGIGRAIALGLAKEGVHVAVLSRTQAEVDETAREVTAFGVKGLAVTADVAGPDTIATALTTVKERLGAPTILIISSSAHYEIQKLHSVDHPTAERLLAVDLGGAVTLCRLAIPEMVMARFGRIVAIGSLAARLGMTGATLYSAAKAGLEGLVRGIAVDYSRRGITANVCNVGFAETERLRSRMTRDPQIREKMEHATALRRLSTPEEIADTVTFLCSPRASSITGAVVDVTGGAHLANLW